MYVVAQHRISNPTKFWAIIREATPNLPAGLRIIQILPAADERSGICVWEARTVETVRAIVESAVGHLSQTEYMAVDADQAFGLPDRERQGTASAA